MNERDFVELFFNSDGISCWCDLDTGVLYLCNYKGGITPMYNEDGTLKTHHYNKDFLRRKRDEKK